MYQQLFFQIQMVLYLLMCIPATLPAAFLAFNQVFLSATPDHWCHVNELANSSLSLEAQKNLSIPLRPLPQGVSAVVYEHCVQYNVNFTKIFEENNNQWPSEPDPDWPKKPCSEGWDYDLSEYKDTLVTEVRVFKENLIYYDLLYYWLKYGFFKKIFL